MDNLSTIRDKHTKKGTSIDAGANNLRESPNARRVVKKSLSHEIAVPRDSEKGFPLVQVSEYGHFFSDLIISAETKVILERVISENRSLGLLSQYGLKPKNKLLFCGPPGTGKTLTSRVMSSLIGYPHVYVRFDSILSSYLGETATNLRKIFDFIGQGKWVVLFDEFDIIGKKRDDPHEHGEIKRIVNNFMQMLDTYEGESIIIAATNHQHLLDSAIWRRFDEVVFFEMPDLKRREQLFEKYLAVLRKDKRLSLQKYARKTKGFSAADIAQVCENALRQTIIRGGKEVTDRDINWSIAEQNRKKKIIRIGEK